MIILFTTVLLLIIGILLIKYLYKISRFYDFFEFLGICLVVINSIDLLVMVLFLIINHSTVTRSLIEYNSIKNTIETQRNYSNPIENAALTEKIISINVEIESDRYWNSTLWDIWIPDILVEERELIK